MNIISLRKQPEYLEVAIDFFQESWPEVFPPIYDDCLQHSVHSESKLPRWYLLQENGLVVGGAGLITNDFISRMDLYPWLCALYVKEGYRGNKYSVSLIDHIKEEASRLGFKSLYLSTDMEGFYEKQGFAYLGQGYHPWGSESRIYRLDLLF